MRLRAPGFRRRRFAAVPCAPRRKPAAEQLAHPCAQTVRLSPASGSGARRLHKGARRRIGPRRHLAWLLLSPQAKAAIGAPTAGASSRADHAPAPRSGAAGRGKQTCLSTGMCELVCGRPAASTAGRARDFARHWRAPGEGARSAPGAKRGSGRCTRSRRVCDHTGSSVGSNPIRALRTASVARAPHHFPASGSRGSAFPYTESRNSRKRTSIRAS